MASLFQTMGLAANLFRPNPAELYGGGGTIYDPTAGFIQTLTDRITTYKHTLRAVGGFYSAKLTFDMPLTELEYWWDNALGGHLVITDGANDCIWEGFVDKFTFQMGPYVISRGPLTKMSNRVKVLYSIVDHSTTPPTVGVRTVTDSAFHNDSITRYGIFYRVYSIGGASDALADRYRDTVVNDNGMPLVTKKIDVSSNVRTPKMTFDCTGYWAFLNYPYNSDTTGEIDVSDKLLDVFDVEPNNLFYHSAILWYRDIETNGLQVAAFDNDYRSGWTVVKELLSLGDASYNRYILQIGPNRHITYRAAPTDPEYRMALFDPSQRVTTWDGNTVLPWNVQPGKWILFTDFLIGHEFNVGGNLRDDPRAEFIEQVDFTAPSRLSLKGGTVNNMDQAFAQIGLGVG